jgi:hypothetical protein
MYTLAADGKRNVNAIIDQKWNVIFAADSMNSFRGCNLDTRIGMLFAVLDDGDAAFQSGLHDVNDVFVTEDRRRLVRYKVETIVYVCCRHLQELGEDVVNARHDDCPMTVWVQIKIRWMG